MSFLDGDGVNRLSNEKFEKIETNVCHPDLKAAY